MKTLIASVLAAALAQPVLAGVLEDAQSRIKAEISAPAAALQDSARQRLLNEKLSKSVTAAQADEVRRLIGLGADPNSDSPGFTALETAMIHHGDAKVVAVLLELGARVDTRGICDYTPLHMAASHDRQDAARLLLARNAALEAKTCRGDTPLITAAWNSRPQMMSFLLKRGANPNATAEKQRSALMTALRLAHWDSDATISPLLADPRTDVNLRDQDGMTALKFAVRTGHLSLVTRLLQAPGIDVNDDAGGMTALFLAELEGYKEIAQLLRNSGAASVAKAR